MMPNGKHPGFIESFGYALSGLKEAILTERNIKVMLGVGLCAVIAGVVLRLDALSWAIILFLIGSVLCAELMNTAIEAAVDVASPTEHPLAKKAKDIAAAAVIIMSATAAVVGLVVYINAGIKLL
ncbi:MAG: diacylglycerol kinase family protein [Coriobacteriales bacterium]|nr:diacylglycerol kinase family protein [Coriobacteriales bacterium]